MSKPILALVFAGTLLTPGLLPAQDAADKQAREVVEQFMKAVKAEDLDAVMKVCDVPFFQDGQKVIKDKDQLKKEFAEVFKDKDLTQIVYEIKEVHAFEKIQDKLRAQDVEMLKEILAKGDRVVFLDVKVGDKADKVALMVRLRDGQAKVAGLRD